jgi:hypothetical protein
VNSCGSPSTIAPAATAPQTAVEPEGPPRADGEQAAVFSSPGSPVAQLLPAEAADQVRRQRLGDWLRARLPPGGRVDEAAGGALVVIHTAAPGDTPLAVAKAYLDLTDVYRVKDLAAAIAKESPAVRPGTEVPIPHVLADPVPDPGENRMAWPADRALKGIYITGQTAGLAWPETLERVEAHGLNAIVLDVKEYAGAITYPTHVKLALESGAGSNPSIRDLSRAIRFAHERGISVIARLTCFHDPWLAGHLPRTAVRSTSGGPAAIGWVDPANTEVQDYLVDLVHEVLELGADEIQLDYVRFPVQDLGDAAMLPADGHRSRAIASFVARVHAAAEARHVPLSLDVFGIAASAPRADVEALGQNLVLLGPEAEAISPMVYPSHYPVGYLGFEQPGDHPELVGVGTKAAVTKLSTASAGAAVIRPWLQASSFRTSNFGPKYIQDEIRSAEENGAVGWLMWDAGNNYWAVWKALPAGEGPRQTTKPVVNDGTASRALSPPL